MRNGHTACGYRQLHVADFVIEQPIDTESRPDRLGAEVVHIPHDLCITIVFRRQN